MVTMLRLRFSLAMVYRGLLLEIGFSKEVGLAVFTEKGIDPWSGRAEDGHNRFAASPFAEAPMSRAR